MDKFWDRVETVLEKHAPLVFATLRPPATEAQVAEAEALLELQFPAEIRAAYLRHDGQVEGNEWTNLNSPPSPNIFHFGFNWCNLEQLKAIWKRDFKMRWERRAEEPELFPDYDSSWDELDVRPLWWNRKWIPIGISAGQFNAYVDTDPAPKGVVGQLLLDGDDGEASVFAPGLNAYLSALLDLLESGDVVHDQQHGFIGGKKRCRIYTLFPAFRLMEDRPIPPSTAG
jgi:cell wall assembly regulator SMI1